MPKLQSRHAMALAFLLVLQLAACGGDNGDGSSAPEAVSAQVSMESGSLAGNARDANGVLSFKGIPFAAPPVGANRWQPPAAVPGWAGTRDATNFGAQCWQSSLSMAPVAVVNATSSEDCLFLNIWTGAASTSEKRPVMVWIHGGGFVFGSGAKVDGSNLARKGVVVVSLNYRLGAFGFLAHPALTQESASHSSGAYGFMDMQAGLAWVQRNIARFGGDPANVTLFGESAGSHAISMLMASPLSKGLFQKAIGESGAFWESEHPGLPRQLHDAEQMGVTIGNGLNAVTAVQLRGVSALSLQTATDWNTFNTDPGYTVPGPLIDGVVLPKQTYAAYAAGEQMNIPTLIGWNEEESGFFTGRSLDKSSAQTFQNAAAAKFGQGRMANFLAAYPASTDAQAVVSANKLIGDEVIAYPTWAWAVAHQRTSKSKVFVYRFNPSSAYLPAADHGDEINWVFDTLSANSANVAPSTADIALSQQMATYWTNFAKNGDPNSTGLPAWPLYAGPGSNIMFLGNRTAMTSAAGAETDTAGYAFLHNWLGRN